MNKNKYNIPVFMIAANDIVEPMCVTMASILANTQSFIQFYILEKSTLLISEENKNKILKLKDHFSNFSIEYIPINPEDYSGLTPTTAGYIPNDTYFRYIIPEIKPNIDKAIYLDVDIIVKKDIKDLYNENLDTNLIGAINHPSYCWKYPYFSKVIKNLNLHNSNQYFNGGVILFDCKKCRRQKITQKLMEITRKLKDKILWADQDIFNLVFEKKVKLLPEKYNALRSVYEAEKINDKNIIDDLYIIHFNGKEKPWNNTPYLSEYFWKYVQFTPFETSLLFSCVRGVLKVANENDPHVHFLLRKINEYETLGCKGKLEYHIPFILGKIKEYDTLLYSQKLDNKTFHIKILGIPFLKILQKVSKTKIYLFDILPLLKITQKGKNRKYLLFGFLPILSKKEDKNKLKYKFLSFIPFYEKSEKVHKIKEKLIPYNPIKGKKIKIYFLFQSPAFLPSWKSFYDACVKDTKMEVKVLFCPTRSQLSGFGRQFENAEQWLIDNHITYSNIAQIDWKSEYPDILVIQTPYDEYHREKIYWTENFRKKGIRCVYISYGLEFTETPFAIENHFLLPIYQYCWKIYKFSKDIVKDYAKFSSVKKKNVVCVGHPKFDALFSARNIAMPQWLKKKIKGRKIICWHTHFPCKYSTQDGKDVVSTFSWQDNLKILDLIKQDTVNFYIFMPHHMFFDVWEKQFGISPEEINKFKKSLLEGENSTVWYGEYPEVLAWSDAFLGERSAVTMEMITTGKPVCYLEKNAEIYNKFGKSVVSAYYYASDFNGVQDFFDLVKNNNDYKKDKREKVFQKYFLPFWDGKCGERIKNDILNSLSQKK